VVQAVVVLIVVQAAQLAQEHLAKVTMAQQQHQAQVVVVEQVVQLRLLLVTTLGVLAE
jgi:hypothetical protein